MNTLPDRFHARLAQARTTTELAQLAGQYRERWQQSPDNPADTPAYTELADALTRRLMDLAIHSLGPLPAPCAWIAHGSQGRQEMTACSDQDNALILADEADPARHGEYFAALAEAVCGGLEACGIVRCPGGMMATNPAWRLRLGDWKQLFSGWMLACTTHQARLASNLFDLRHIAGEASLSNALTQMLSERCPQADALLARWIANAAGAPAALGLFQRFQCDRDGRFDLKRNAIIPLVELARIHALAAGYASLGTAARLADAAGRRWLSRRGSEELLDAWRRLLTLRREHAPRPGDPRIDPQRLTREEKDSLRRILRLIERHRAALRLIYPGVPLH